MIGLANEGRSGARDGGGMEDGLLRGWIGMGRARGSSRETWVGKPSP